MADNSLAYRDADGRPLLKHSIVAFFDILGFSQMSTRCETMEDAQRVLDNVAAAIENARRSVRQSLTVEVEESERRWATKFFSDNLAFGYPLEGKHREIAAAAWFVIGCAQRYQLAMARCGYFLRGGLTHGPICLTDDIIFGAALVECYQLESKASIVPRVILAESLEQILLGDQPAAGNPAADASGNAICRDVDGRWFVNYLQATVSGGSVEWPLIERHKDCILESLSHATRHEVLPKYGWACRYHNLFCHWHRDDPGYSDRYRIDRTDEQSTMYRLCDLPPAC